jgi:hypothetical protein
MPRFQDNEAGYRNWIRHNKHGYVINYQINDRFPAADPILHRAQLRFHPASTAKTLDTPVRKAVQRGSPRAATPRGGNAW